MITLLTWLLTRDTCRGAGWGDGGVCAVSGIPEKRGELQILMLVMFSLNNNNKMRTNALTVGQNICVWELCPKVGTCVH